MCAVLTELMIFEIEHETNKKARKQGTLLPCSPNFGSSVSSLTILLYSIYRLSTVCFCGSPPPELGAGLWSSPAPLHSPENGSALSAAVLPWLILACFPAASFSLPINKTKKPRQQHASCRRSRFSASQKYFFTHRAGAKKLNPIPVGLLTCVSDDNLSAFSDFSNDWLSSTAGYLDTYSAGSAGTYTPLSCSARYSSCAIPGHGNIYSTVIYLTL